jgi:hypothetical protein
MTVDELVRLIRAKERQANQPRSNQTGIELACWFVAMTEAQQVHESFSLKDLAWVIKDGLPIGGPYKTRDDLVAWVGLQEEGHDPTVQDPWEWLDAALNVHFGLEG